MHLPQEIWENIAAYSGVSGMAGASKALRAAWQHHRKPEKNPHVAFVRRSRRDVAHIAFCNSLDAELDRCPQRQLSCWNFFKVDLKTLNKAEMEVLESLARKLKVELTPTCQIEFSTRGVILRTSSQKRRAVAAKMGRNYDSGRWALYMRLVLLPAMTRRSHTYPGLAFLAKDEKRLTTRRPWKVGRQITVMRSRLGLNAVHCIDDAKPTTKGAFQWLCKGISLPNHYVNVTEINPIHPLSTFVEEKHFVSASDMHVWDKSVSLWP